MTALRLTRLLTAWSRVLEKLTGSQLVKKFPAFYETRRFITAFTSARHLSVSWASSLFLSIPHQSPVYTSPLPIRATCPTHLTLLDLIAQTILGEVHRSLSPSICSFLHSAVTSSLLGPNILLNTLSLRSALRLIQFLLIRNRTFLWLCSFFSSVGVLPHGKELNKYCCHVIISFSHLTSRGNYFSCPSDLSANNCLSCWLWCSTYTAPYCLISYRCSRDNLLSSYVHLSSDRTAFRPTLGNQSIAYTVPALIRKRSTS